MKSNYRSDSKKNSGVLLSPSGSSVVDGFDGESIVEQFAASRLNNGTRQKLSQNHFSTKKCEKKTFQRMENFWWLRKAQSQRGKLLRPRASRVWRYGKVHAWKSHDRHKLQFNLSLGFKKFNNTNARHHVCLVSCIHARVRISIALGERILNAIPTANVVKNANAT